METTFITIHNTSANANILYASASIIDILGYEAQEVVGVSVFDYFHPEDVPLAKEKHSDSIHQDKAAVIHYARIMNSAHQWVSCECVFTVVYDVLVACTSIYKRNDRNIQREEESKVVQQSFKSVPKDPRYFMLEHLQPKFEAPADPSRRERRAALILNRFTRTLAILYATDSVAALLGVTPEQIDGKSFYECIHENCHADAIRVLESAKANDSIAYLRFWYRDPRRPDELENSPSPSASDTDEEGGVVLNQSPERTPMPGTFPGSPMDVEMGNDGTHVERAIKEEPDDDDNLLRPGILSTSRTNSDRSDRLGHGSEASMFDGARSQQSRSSTSSAPSVSAQRRTNGTGNASPRNQPIDAIMVEAVVSCSSDGMVVILRRVQDDELAAPAPEPAQNGYENQMQQQPQQNMRAMQQQSIFAAPWGAQPIVPGYQPERALAIDQNFMPHLQALEAHAAATGGPQNPQFMQTIREVAVFAWALTGINGNIARHAHGTPQGPAIPPYGFPVWDRNAPMDSIEPPHNQANHKWTELHARARGQPHIPLPFTEQEQDPAQYYRQERLVRQQYEQPYGSDAPGSDARRHLGRYMGEDGRGPRMLSQGGNWWLQGQEQPYQGYPQQPPHQPQSYQQESYQQQHYGQSQQPYQQPQQYGPPRPAQQEQGYGQQHYPSSYGQHAAAATAEQQRYSHQYNNAYEQARPVPQQNYGGGAGGSSFTRPPPPPNYSSVSTGTGGPSGSGFSARPTSYEAQSAVAGPSGSNRYDNGNSNAYAGPSGSGYAGYASANASGSGSGSGKGSGSGSGNNSGREGTGSASPDRYLWY